MIKNEFLQRDVAFDAVRNRIEKSLKKSPRIINKYTDYLSQSQGKFIRTHTLLTCAGNDSGEVMSDAVSFCTSIELLHLGTLVHDDVIDNADTRRGIDTLQKKFDKRSAVICGDYIYCLSIEQASVVSDRHKYVDFSVPDYMSRICLGELRQYVNNYNTALAMSGYLRIIAGKTAALFEASAYAGAITLGVTGRELSRYRRLGRFIGMIFQLTDDCIDFEETKKSALKPVQSDYEQGVITLPLIHAFETDKDFLLKARHETLSREEINQHVMQSNGVLFTQKVAKRYAEKCNSIIDSLTATEQKKNDLRQIVSKAYNGLKK